MRDFIGASSTSQRHSPCLSRSSGHRTGPASYSPHCRRLEISVPGLLSNPVLGATMMGQSERKVAVPCRIGECRFGECRLANVRLANKAGEMSPTGEGRISSVGDFFVFWFLFG